MWHTETDRQTNGQHIRVYHHSTVVPMDRWHYH